jgi:hypothetical protein
MLMLCVANTPVSSKLNSGGVGILQGLPMTLVIRSIELISQSKFGSGKLLQASVLCVAATAVSLKLNSGGVGVLQGLPMASFTRLIKLIGQSKVGSGKLSQVSLLEG